MSISAEITNNSKIAVLDADKILFPLTLRKWIEGDFFYPLGMKNPKKLSDFFIDNKLSVFDKENAYVIGVKR